MTKVELPAYWLPRPDFRPDRRTAASFDRLLDAALDRSPDRPVDYRLDAPKWQFLCHVADRGDVVLHGSGAPIVPNGPAPPPRCDRLARWKPSGPVSSLSRAPCWGP
ncbi:hypothetical protein [Actinacidiphila acididurans]|uniref:Uncharacterized protein n=1 Tax=Actinacidiphila acididurans TaxID=2784346 RepID=A0ABS2TLY2_9ACTN|nr:hypothetical protein [Actinacidiphila acididurans]MBM9504347.1 hypothetical protein [Actinacidiphila acididurans]